MKKKYICPSTTEAELFGQQLMAVKSLPVNDNGDDDDVDDHDDLLIKPEDENWLNPPVSSLWEERE